jgi:hypothetical protein
LRKKPKLKDVDDDAKSNDTAVLDAKFEQMEDQMAVKYKKVHEFNTPLPTARPDWIK